LRELKPKHVIESGVYRGQGTWLIRETIGPNANIFCIDPRDPDQLLKYKDKNPNTMYLMGSQFQDFGKQPWHTLIPGAQDRENALVVLDDHMSAVKRVQQMLGFGFTHLWYDDNWKYEKVDVYSFNTMCSPLKSMEKNVLYLDNFGTTKVEISRSDHEKNVRFLVEAIDSYFEFPALYNICGEKLPGAAGNRSCMGSNEVNYFWEKTLNSKSPFIAIDFMTYHPPYVKLKKINAISNLQLWNETTPYKLKSKSSKSAGADSNTGVFDISLS
jgi:hypothetical protein